MLGFSRESIGFDVAVNAIAVTVSIPLTVEIETNECSTCAVVAQSKLGVVGIPPHAARNSARLSCLSEESPRLYCSSAG